MTESSLASIEREISRSELVVGYGYDFARLARKHGRRFIACLEYDLQTQLVVARSSARNPLHAAWSMFHCIKSYYTTMVPTMRHSYQVHCNGYPIHAKAEALNPNTLLYMDSRIACDMIISEPELEARLETRESRPLRLIYSGRFEPMKGSLDAVQAAVTCLERGLDIEMDLFGMGSLLPAMKEAAEGYADRVRIHAPIAFPELVLRARAADIFVCCHIQSDPSCTYVESMGSGLPILGYRNRMWSAMAGESEAGWLTRSNTPTSIADSIAAVIGLSGEIDRASRNARNFAIQHCFENEFLRRTDSINAAMQLSH